MNEFRKVGYKKRYFMFKVEIYMVRPVQLDHSFAKEEQVL